VVTQHEVLLAVLHLGLVDGFQVSQDLRPFRGNAGVGEALLQLLSQNEGEKQNTWPRIAASDWW
jgi:hypothetical protein